LTPSAEDRICFITTMQEDEELTSKSFAPGVFNDSIKYHLTGMYQDWFLDYASYVILDRSVPNIYDGLKPVQRRILHAMKCVDDGRFNKVANIVGQTMQYHPHGDASIGDALVGLGQKNLLIDCQGNWGNIITGDGAAAPRYIEARLSKFALEAVFNAKTTHWMLSYDGRKKEPVTLPIKFPLLLAQGVEGIAVGLNSKILPHNFNEICDAALAYLHGEDFQLYPDFLTGGTIDVSKYNDGERGGVVKIRAKITKSADNKQLTITEIPYGTNTGSLITSIRRAYEKGKIKIRKVENFTAAEACIVVQLAPGASSDKTIDALYAFTDCEVNVSPNCCVIKDKKPIFTNVSGLLRESVDHTKELLLWELNIQKAELLEQYFFTSLEKIFIENRIYKEKEFEQATSKDNVIDFIDKKITPFKEQLIRDVHREDIEKLLEIKTIRFTKFDSKAADDLLIALDKRIKDVEKNIKHLTEYTITWFTNLKKKYGAEHQRKTELRNFETIVAAKVVEANEKLYVNWQEGFVGTGLKKDEYVCNCSDMDDIILFFKDGKYKVVKVEEKLFAGQNLLHVAVFKKNDIRTIYNVVYRDGKGGFYYMKRFAATGLTRGKEYDVTQGTTGSRIAYFSANPNGEAEVIRVQLKAEKNELNFGKVTEVLKDFSQLAIKGRASRGNLVTKKDVSRITLKHQGGSTLGGRKVWFDWDVLRLNYDAQGTYIGEYGNDDSILVITRTGDYYTTSFDLTNHYPDTILRLEKFHADKIWSAALWNEDLGFYYAKRFLLDATSKSQNFLGENANNKLLVLTDQPEPVFQLQFSDHRAPQDVQMIDFIEVKGAKTKGKRLTTLPIAAIVDITPQPEPEEVEADDLSVSENEVSQEITPVNPVVNSATIDFEINASMPDESLPADNEDK